VNTTPPLEDILERLGRHSRLDTTPEFERAVWREIRHRRVVASDVRHRFWGVPEWLKPSWVAGLAAVALLAGTFCGMLFEPTRAETHAASKLLDLEVFSHGTTRLPHNMIVVRK
jgi:hypothetical protein